MKRLFINTCLLILLACSAFSCSSYSREYAQGGRNKPTDIETAKEWCKKWCFEHRAGAEYDRAIEECSRSIEHGGTKLEQAIFYFNRACAHTLREEYDEAIADYDEALELYPKYVWAYSFRGIAYHRKGEYDRAIADYDSALEVNPIFPFSYNDRGLAYMAKGKYDRAIADYEKAIELYPEYAPAYYNRGNAYSSSGNYDMAITDYSRAIELDPEHVQAYNNRGMVYDAKGDYDKALDDHNKVIELYPRLFWTYSRRGIHHAIRGDYEKAIADYSMAISLDPKHEHVYLFLVIASSKLSDKRYESATKNLEKFVSTTPSSEWIRTISIYYLSLEGHTEDVVLAEAGNGEDDKEVKERLCEAYYYLGEERLRRGDRKGAEEFFKKGIETEVRHAFEYILSKANLRLMEQGKL